MFGRQRPKRPRVLASPTTNPYLENARIAYLEHVGQNLHLIDLLDQPCPGTAGSFGQLRFWSVRVRPSGGISFNLIRSTAWGFS